jgi:flavodoxin short chain
MSTAVVYYSLSGNTEMMAKAIAEGAGTEDVYSVDEAVESDVLSHSSIALGCPAMGSEELEANDFEPFMDSIASSLKGKKVALFGSYDWGDGEWMRIWQENLESMGITLIQDGLICNNEPTDDDIESCKALGKALA